MTDLEAWYAVQCRPYREWQAAAGLESYLYLTVYLPEISSRFRQQGRRVPLFPGYLFARANLQVVRLSGINSTPGVIRLVSFGGMPQPLPDAAIESIRELVDSFNTRRGPSEHSFRLGEAVRFRSGPLQGLEAIFAGPMKPSERVRVLIEFLGQCRQAEVDPKLLEHVVAAPIAKRERRTRGNGRKIRKS